MSKIYFISGIGPDSSGTGRLIHALMDSKKAMNDKRVRFLYQYRKTIPIKIALKEKRYKDAVMEAWRRSSNIIFWTKIFLLSRFTSVPMVFFHMQSFKTERAWKILSQWRGHISLFVLDAGVFCIRSYNHVLGENEPCTRCLNRQTQNIAKRGCESFPLPDPYFQTFVENLPILADEGRLQFLTQSNSQTELLSGHFPENAISTVGLWTADWDELGNELSDIDEPVLPDPDFEWDVVFHGYFVGAKGADWLYEVAKHAPGVKFLFSCSRNVRVTEILPNIKFQPMSWHTGLKEAVAKSKLALAPSLWSAPIEGALIKNILVAPQAGVVKSSTAYGSEIDDNMLFQISSDPKIAAKEIEKIVASHNGPSQKQRFDWWNSFANRNRNVLSNIIQAADKQTSE